MTQKQAEIKVLNKYPKAVVEEDYKGVMQWICVTDKTKARETIGYGCTIAEAWKDSASNV